MHNEKSEKSTASSPNRRSRELMDGGTYHIMGRGIRRTCIFDDKYDVHMFRLALLREMEKQPFVIHSYCMMTNHFHILLTTPAGTSLSAAMQNILYRYARKYNDRHGYSGHLFERRFTSCLVKDEAYFMECSRYIHLNPVEAGIVYTPAEYIYSSYPAIINEKADDLLSRDLLLSMFQGSPARYRDFVEGNISHAEQESQIREAMHDD